MVVLNNNRNGIKYGGFKKEPRTQMHGNPSLVGFKTSNLFTVCNEI